ncbi:hypothetical protein HMPREF0973_01936 [Prevotella veroralis F0319]|uniref:Uncharacterized protein n=1 Tax=Prevotella veroralis F0319 TaxID=649761 RepID=C9MQN6_9BACT|nr:hypothetical protein HMPREF0973_01936 [Prevotella veroralis F0319]
MYANVTAGGKTMDKNVYAVIAMALYEFAGNNVHDIEPSIITIKPKQTMWDAKFEIMTKKP